MNGPCWPARVLAGRERREACRYIREARRCIRDGAGPALVMVYVTLAHHARAAARRWATYVCDGC